jgi:hypothetical protein
VVSRVASQLKTDQQKYLGFMISSKGDNMKNIKEMKNKSVWIINKIFNRLDSLNLKKYFFESAIIFLNVNVNVRRNILYASEAYYNLKVEPDSMIYKSVKIQFQNPTRGDWASSFLENLEYLEIKMSLEEIQSIIMNKFISLLRKSIKKKALEYLKQI